MTEIAGVERKYCSSSLIPIGGKLPYYLELQTSVVLTCLQTVIPNASGMDKRRQLAGSLASRARVGMYLELTQSFHLAYADQRNGRGSQHWWRLFFDDSLRATLERAARSTAIAVGQERQQPAQTNSTTPAQSAQSGHPHLCWGGMYFRSKVEMVLAQALQRRGVLFFANSQGMASLQGLPVTLSDHGMVERLEADFLIFRGGHCLCLEVDGRHHQQAEQAFRDYAKERVLLREHISTVRFPAQDCLVRPDAVVTEVLNLFPH